MARCTSTPAPPPGPSSSASSRARSGHASETRLHTGSGSPRDRFRRLLRQPPSARGSRRRSPAPSNASRPAAGPPESTPTNFAKQWKKLRAQASRGPLPAAPSGRLRSARKCASCRAFFMAKASYTAKDITVLEGLEPVRLRPGMYIGSTGARGLHQLVYEVIDNAVDEALAGRADTMVLTKLHAGGKFGGEGYKVSGGLHGVGVSVVNALSEWLTVEVRRDGKLWRQEFARGEPTTDLKKAGVAKDTGTTISFLPDGDIFEELEWSSEVLVQRLRETAFLTKGLRIVLVDEREGEDRHEFYAEGGIKDFVAYVNGQKDPVHKHIVYFEGASNGDSAEHGEVEVAMQWNTSYVESVFSFANNINTHEGGSHLSGFKSALTG